MKTSVYVETTVISYLTANISRDLLIAAHQQSTIDWWQTVRPMVECYISPFVINEITHGDEQLAKRRLEAVEGFALLGVNEEIEKLAEQYYAAIELPDRAKADAFHLATASWYRVEYMLSWNLKHIASARVRKIIREVNDQLGKYTPVICTPEELMEV
jgi:hypothetical protein